MAEETKVDQIETGKETEVQGGSPQSAEAKYTDADLDKIIARKIAAERQKAEKRISEAEKLTAQNAEKKSEDRIRDLETKLATYEAEQNRSKMMASARAILHEQNVNVSDDLLAHLIADDADATEESITSFVTLFNEAVNKQVQERLRGSAPRTGGHSSLTKEDILKVENKFERQKLIREHPELF